MRELRTCDFCDGDAVGTFEVLPPELEPTEAEQRRVVCCRQCRDRLEVLLEPLVARASGDSSSVMTASGDDAASASSDEDADEASDEERDDAGQRASAGTGAEDADGNANEDRDGAPVTLETDGFATASSGSDSSASDSKSTSDSASESDDESSADAGSNTGSSDADGPSETNRGARSKAKMKGKTRTKSKTRSKGDSDDESAGDAAAATESTFGEGKESSSATEKRTKRPPKAYGKVVRLLRNREFPVQRSDVEALAAGAYDLNAHEVTRVIDYAIEQGEVREDGDKLRR